MMPQPRRWSSATLPKRPLSLQETDVIEVVRQLRTAANAVAIRAPILSYCESFAIASALRLGNVQPRHSPPSIGSTSPLMYDAASETRKAMTDATSSAVAKRPDGLRSRARRAISSFPQSAAANSVFTMLGATALTRMPTGPSSDLSEIGRAHV